MRLELRNAKNTEEVKFVDVEDDGVVIRIKVDGQTIFKLYKDMDSAIAFPSRATKVGFENIDFI